MTPLGLVWLDKWGPIWWEWGFRKLRIATGPSPPPHEQGLTGRVADLDKNRCQAMDGPTFPQVYADLAKVFSEAECEVLPPPTSPQTASSNLYPEQNYLSPRCIR